MVGEPIPPWLVGNIPLQRRYFAALRSSQAGGCSSGCAKAAIARKFQQLAIQTETKKIAGRPRKR